MTKLSQFFGALVSTFFVVDGGVSLSEIGRHQAEAKQQNDKFWGKVQAACRDIFQKVVTFLGGAGSHSQPFQVAKLDIKQLREYAHVADRNAQTANLMFALKLHKQLMERVRFMEAHELAQCSLPEAPARPRPAQQGTVCDTDRFMELNTIDEMVQNLKPEVLARFDFDFWARAQSLNSRAAALGRLLSADKAFFRELVKSVPAGTEKVTESGVVITAWESTYTDQEIAELEELRGELQTEYDDLQKQLNGCRKQVKDAVREHNLVEERRYQADLRDYRVAAEKHTHEVEAIHSRGETVRQELLAELASLRVRTA